MGGLRTLESVSQDPFTSETILEIGIGGLEYLKDATEFEHLVFGEWQRGKTWVLNPRSA